jgi:triosephosphate isomerase
MTLPEDAPVDKYRTILIYERNGVKKEFSENNIPWQDTTWKWVETQQKLVSKGAVAPIHDFSVTCLNGEDITDSVLTDDGYTFLIISHDIEKAGNKAMLRLDTLAARAKELGYKSYCLTSSTTDHIEQFTREFNPVFEVCTTDGTTLKTIIRSNPGLMVLRNGTILAKWNYRDTPEPHELDKDFMKTLLSHQTVSSETSSVMFIILIAALFYSLFFMAFIRRE